jgi:hypothetical protein
MVGFKSPPLPPTTKIWHRPILSPGFYAINKGVSYPLEHKVTARPFLMHSPSMPCSTKSKNIYPDRVNACFRRQKPGPCSLRITDTAAAAFEHCAEPVASPGESDTRRDVMIAAQ